ncbi:MULTISPECIES: hypothetical protein [unclassified Crossiella]|uniref:hypothetical protein n=1 Tax=unclassified Crossiella TaxID=2620835 RepID=UPI001FFEDE93|nr:MULTISPECIES: hypothetical protein [unclassified Crossiella]MCK2242958.1 hypothetical protein [Crossiella sp. S99.2]MCK2256835.1 hypothetical protein [Crossiella sp. S99.1]
MNRAHTALVWAVDSMFLVTDRPDDPPADLLPALDASHLRIAGADTGIIVVQCVESLIQVAVRVEVWPHAPAVTPADREWTGPVSLEFRSRQGVLAVRQHAMPDAIEHIELPQGPGAYRADFWHAGRAEMAGQQADLAHRLSRLGTAEWEALAARLAGTEGYLLRIWPG